MIISRAEQLADLQRVGQFVARTWLAMRDHAQPGMTTAELDDFATTLFATAGMQSAPRLCYDFPGTTCISINEQAAHGIPGARQLMHGDLINIDISAEWHGVFADTGASFVLGSAPQHQQRLKQRLCDAARAARDSGISLARSGQMLNRIGRGINNTIHAHGFRNVRNLCGHGVGQWLHEEPTIRNYHDRRDTQRLQVGQVITIEPFLATNVSQVRTQDDGWTLAGRPSSLFAQFEHTLVVTEGAPIIVTLP